MYKICPICTKCRVAPLKRSLTLAPNCYIQRIFAPLKVKCLKQLNFFFPLSWDSNDFSLKIAYNSFHYRDKYFRTWAANSRRSVMKQYLRLARRSKIAKISTYVLAEPLRTYRDIRLLKHNYPGRVIIQPDSDILLTLPVMSVAINFVSQFRCHSKMDLSNVKRN